MICEFSLRLLGRSPHRSWALPCRGHTWSCENNSSHPRLLWFGHKSTVLCLSQKLVCVKGRDSFFCVFLDSLVSQFLRGLGKRIMWMAGSHRPSKGSNPSWTIRACTDSLEFHPRRLVGPSWEQLLGSQLRTWGEKPELREILTWENLKMDTNFILSSLPSPFHLILQMLLTVCEPLLTKFVTGLSSQ